MREDSNFNFKDYQIIYKNWRDMQVGAQDVRELAGRRVEW